MNQTVRLGRIAGVPIGAHWSALVILGLVAQILATVVLPAAAPGEAVVRYWAIAVVAAVLFVTGLLAHELAHAMVARHYRIRVERITLWALGGVAELADEPRTPRADLLVAAAGPVASTGVAGFFFVAGQLSGLAGAPAVYVAALMWLALISLFLAVFNLLPGAPLDGGRVLRAALWWRHGDLARARSAAARVGVLLGVLLIATGVVEILVTGAFSGLWLMLIGWFLTSAARAERAFGAARDELARMRVGDVMTTDMAVVPAWSTVVDLMEVAAHRRQRIFPVIDIDGRVSGVVTLARLAQVPARDRPRVRLQEIAEPLALLTVVAPDISLADVIAARGGWALVVEHGHVAGLLTGDDVGRALELARLSIRPHQDTQREGAPS